MSWHFSQALVAVFSEENFWGGELSAALKSSPTPQVFLSKDRMKAFSTRSLSGMTFAPLTESLGEELLTWFLGDFLVKTLVSEEKERASKAREADSGKKGPASSARYDRDSRSWKIALCLQDEDSGLFSEIWPKWGTMRNGVCSEASISGLGINANECGFSVPTIGKNEYKGCSRKRFRGSPAYRGAKMSEGLRTSETDPMYTHPNFAEQAMGWPITWTELRPLEMDRFQQWQQAHGVNS
jgi:hypothetical protein